MQTADFFAGHPAARAVFDKVKAILDHLGPVEVTNLHAPSDHDRPFPTSDRDT
jgi:hypothetical protein